MNQPPLLPSLLGGPAPGETFFPMQDDVIHYAGQPVAIVVADSLEQAQHAATLVQVSYAETPSVTTIDQGRADAYEPERSSAACMPGQMRRGNVEPTGSRPPTSASTRRSRSRPTTTTRSRC